jgi:hypothetical protein
MWKFPRRRPEARAQPTAIEAPVVPEGALWWGPEVFVTPDGPANACPTIIDLTGRSRYLVFGPYLALSPGLWRARAFVDLCPDAARRLLAFEFGADPDYTSVDIIRGVPGRHVVELEHRMSGEGLAQVRLWLKKPAFHGRARFLGAAIERLDDA